MKKVEMSAIRPVDIVEKTIIEAGLILVEVDPLTLVDQPHLQDQGKIIVILIKANEIAFILHIFMEFIKAKIITLLLLVIKIILKSMIIRYFMM